MTRIEDALNAAVYNINEILGIVGVKVKLGPAHKACGAGIQEFTLQCEGEAVPHFRHDITLSVEQDTMRAVVSKECTRVIPFPTAATLDSNFACNFLMELIEAALSEPRPNQALKQMN